MHLSGNNVKFGISDYCEQSCFQLESLRANLISIMVFSLVPICLRSCSNLLESVLYLAWSFFSSSDMQRVLIFRESYSSFKVLTSRSSLLTYDALMLMSAVILDAFWGFDSIFNCQFILNCLELYQFSNLKRFESQ